MGRFSKKKKGRNVSAVKETEVPKKKGRTLHCYKCSKEVSEFDEGCPHCGAKPPRINPAVLARVLLGIVLALILYIYFM